MQIIFALVTVCVLPPSSAPYPPQTYSQFFPWGGQQQVNGPFLPWGGQPDTTATCESVSEYQTLRHVISGHPCISNTQIWLLLEPLAIKHRHCLIMAFTEITAYVETGKDHQENCQCTGDFPRQDLNFVFGHDNWAGCFYANPDCKYLFDYFYHEYGQHNQWSQCKTHHHVWKHLRDTHFSIGDPQESLVLHLGSTFSHGKENLCTCHTGQVQPIPHVTDAPPMTTTHVPPTTTHSAYSTKLSTVLQTSTPKATSPLAIPKCQKYNVISDIANSLSEEHPSARQCSTGQRTSHEAYVIVNCGLGSSDTWQKGVNVMTNCDNIPLYTPIAAANTNTGDQKWILSGIFLGCVNGGFKMAYQDCGLAPSLVHVDGINGTGKLDPDSFSVIL